MTVYYIWMCLLGFACYVCIVDKNVAEYVNLFIMGVIIQLKRYYFMAIIHPKNHTIRIMERKTRKMAAELLKEFGIEEEGK